ncbi:MAG: Ig-like domain-containing protein, partial [Chloroflexi bacterium]|nr:Ig-like domain-containing protein [Chloroflexota bacterium]
MPSVGQAVRADATTDLPGGVYAPAVIAYLSKPLDPATVTTANVQVLSGATPVVGEVRWNGLDQSVVFSPLEPLTPGATYDAELSTALADNSGNHLAASYRWSFTTFPAGDLAASPAVLDLPATIVGQSARRT